MRPFNARSIPLPQVSVPLAGIIGRSPLDIEIGAGQGLHAIRYAQAHPDRTLVAVERTHNRFARLESRHARHAEVSNLVPLHADAVSVFVHCLPDESVDRVFLLYPNPYPKSKQANLRWHNMPFMGLLKQKLKPGGELTLATNIAAYADEAERKMVGEWDFQLAEKRLVDAASSPRTHFERKYLERNERCWNLIFVKDRNLSTMGSCQ